MGNKNYNNNEGGLQINNNNQISPYNLIYHFPINTCDCINSIDIFDDKVAIGTIMGNAYLIRVDKNNLDINENQDNIFSNINANFDNNIFTLKQNSKDKNEEQITNLNNKDTVKNKITSYANKKLNNNEDAKESQTIENTNDLSKLSHGMRKIKMIRLNSKLKNNEKYNNSVSIKKRNIKISNIIIKKEDKKENNKIMLDATNIIDEEEKQCEIEVNINNNFENSFIKDKNIDKKTLPENNQIKKFPQITKLIDGAYENICCIHFDTDDILNISIGDFEVIRMNNLRNFNINDENSKYDYIKIQNYDADHVARHFKYCEHATCMMTSTKYLIIFTYFGNFTDEIILNKSKYNSVDLLELNQKIKGNIPIHNFSVPFDFDGKYFLFLDHISKEECSICLFDTINNKMYYKYPIEKNFGHISHMKILSDIEIKIFVCSNNSQCGIHILDEKFTCIESFEHIGDDIINIFIYYKESKLSETFKRKIKNNKKQKALNINSNIYDDYIKINNNKSKSLIRINSDSLNKNSKNQKITLENKERYSSLININDNKILSRNNFNSINSDTDKRVKEIKLHIKENSNTSSKNQVTVYNKKILNEESKDHFNDFSFGQKNPKKYSKNDEEKKITIESNQDNDESNYYIFTLDNNGDLNMYKNKTIKTLFNVYNVQGIDDIYKKQKFFSTGFPYYITMNELYFAISTDYGLFVISNQNQEL